MQFLVTKKVIKQKQTQKIIGKDQLDVSILSFEFLMNNKKKDLVTWIASGGTH